MNEDKNVKVNEDVVKAEETTLELPTVEEDKKEEKPAEDTVEETQVEKKAEELEKEEKTPEVKVEEPKAEEKTEAVKEEPTQENVETDADARAAAIDEMEKASQKALEAMREAGNAKNDEVVDEAEKKLEDIFTQFKAWMQENSQPDRIKAEMKHVTDSVNNLINKTRDGVIEVADSEQFKQTMESGKDFVLGTGAMIADGLQHGYDKLLEIPEFKKAANFVEAKVDDLRHSEVLKTFIDRSQEGINQLNNTIFDGLKAFFSPTPTKKSTPTQAPKVDLPDLPEDDTSDHKENKE